MYTGTIQFDINDFVNLLTHYTDGEVPPDAEVLNFGPSTRLQNWYGILVRTKEWPNAFEVSPGLYEPFHFRFEGDRILTMNDTHDGPDKRAFDAL